ncbi:MAG: recombinase family protein [Firmicutes bacterium]|nr:recombinase family protein [Bacillota bacterium]
MNLISIRNKLLTGTPISNLNLRVTYYGRVSTNQDIQLSSLSNQEDYFKQMIQNNINWTYIEGYIDEGITGTSTLKRTNFLRMINDAKQNKFDLIITKEISRFSRNTLDSIKYTRELLNYGVAVLFLNDNINTIYPDSELRLTIMSSMAQDEIRRLSERVKFGVSMSIKKGKLLGNNKLYGYNKKNNKLYINKKESLIIKEIFTLYGIYNKSTTYIRDYLNNKGITTNYGNKWSTTTILRILKNPKYKGFYCANKTFTEDYMSKKVKYLSKEEWVIYKSSKQIPIIIEESLWNKVNNKLTNNSKHITKNVSLYTNKLICTIHNKPLYKRHNKNDTSWICSYHLHNKDNKCYINIKEKEITNILNNIINKLNINYSLILKELSNIYKKEVSLPNINIIPILLDNMLITKYLSTYILKIKLNTIDKPNIKDLINDKYQIELL